MDIVEKLKDTAYSCYDEGALDCLYWKASDEIERLREENKVLRRERSVSELSWAYAGRHKELFEDYMILKSAERMRTMLLKSIVRKFKLITNSGQPLPKAKA